MSTQRNLQTGLFFAALFLLSGCATMFNPQPQSVHISATEGGRPVSVPAQISGRNKVDVQLPAVIPLTPIPFKYTTVTIKDPCYQASNTRLRKTLEPTVLLNFANYFVGMAIDVSTGAMWRFDDAVQIPLVRVAGADCVSGADKPPGVVDVSKPQPLSLKPRVRRNNLHVGVGFPFEYSPAGKGGATFGEQGGGVLLGYEYLFSDRFSVVARAQGASSTRYHGFDSTQASLGGLSIMFNHYFAKMPSLYAGVGITSRSVKLTYQHYVNMYDPVLGFNRYYTEDTKASNAVTQAVLNVGWRSANNVVYIGADVQINSPALWFYHERHTDDLSRIPNAKARADFEQKREKLLRASQLNLLLGYAF